jgi:hypothetical protein
MAAQLKAYLEANEPLPLNAVNGALREVIVAQPKALVLQPVFQLF